MLSKFTTSRGKVLILFSLIATTFLFCWEEDPISTITNTTYTITYDGNGATEGDVPVDTLEYEVGGQFTVLGNTGGLINPDHTFLNWNTEADGSGTVYNAGATFNIGNEDLILYAQWALNVRYTVTYCGNNNDSGVGSLPIDTNSYQSGDTVTILGNTGLIAKAGAIFAEWNTMADGTGDTLITDSTFIMGSDNDTLYAQWKDTTSADVIKPAIKILSPTDGATISVPTIDVTVEATDASGIYQVLINDVVATSSTENRYSLTITLVEGSNPIVVKAIDASSNQNDSTTSISVIYDPTAEDVTGPVFLLQNPVADSLIVTEATLDFSISITDVENEVAFVSIMGEEVTSTSTIYNKSIVLVEGVNKIAVLARDASSNSNETQFEYTVTYQSDKTKPSIVLNSPTENAVVSTTPINVVTTITDISGIAEVAINGTIVQGSDDIFSSDVDLVLGSNEITIIAKDASINSNIDTLKFNITYDPTAQDETGPSIVLVSPKDASYTNESVVNFEVLVSDESSVSWVKFNGVDVALSGSSYNMDVTLHDGENSVIVTAQDNSTGANESSETFTIIYDPDAPVITLVKPSKDTTILENAITVITNILDDNPISNVLFSIGGTNYPAEKIDETSYSAAITGLTANSVSTIEISATDTAGNSSSKSVKITFDPTLNDVTSPTITWSGGTENGAIINTNTGSVELSISDLNGISRVWYELNGTEIGDISNNGGSQYKCDFTLAKYKDNELTIHATDNSSNKNEATYSYKVIYNTIQSKITNPSPNNVTDVENSSGVTFTWNHATDDDQDEITYLLSYGKQNSTFQTKILNNSNTFTATDIDGDTQYNWYVRVCTETDTVFCPAEDIYYTFSTSDHASTITNFTDKSCSVDDNVSFSATVVDAEGIKKYEWFLDGISKGSGSNSITFDAPSSIGTYSVKLEVTDNQDNKTEATRTLTVTNEPPAITASSASPLTITINDAVDFSCTANDPDGRIVSYTWDLNGDNNPEHNSTTTGNFSSIYRTSAGYAPGNTYTALLKVTDEDGNITQKTFNIIIKQDLPTSNAGADTIVEMDASCTLKGVAYDTIGSVASMQWKIGDGSFTNANASGEITFQSPRNYTPNVPCVFRVTDDDGNVVDDERLVTFGRSWTELASANATNSNAVFTCLNGVPYVAYYDANTTNLIAKRFTGSSWETVYTKNEDVYDIRIASDETKVYLFFNNSTKHNVVRINGLNDFDNMWSANHYLYSVEIGAGNGYVYVCGGRTVVRLEGNGFTRTLNDLPYNPGWPVVRVNNNTPYILATERGDMNAEVYKYESDQWVKVGASSVFGGDLSYGGDICFVNNVPHIIYLDTDNSYKAHVKRLNGNSWESLGFLPGASTTTVTGIGVDENDFIYAAHFEFTNNKNEPKVFRLANSSWQTFGTNSVTMGGDGNGDNTNLFIENGTPFIGFYDNGNSQYKVFKFK